jgi:VWFA-related protein
MHVRLLRLAVVPLVLCGAGSSRAQPPGPDEGSRLTFGSQVELVILDLVVRDARGRIVRDLRPEEVLVFEDGVRQTVTGFRAMVPEATAEVEEGVTALPATPKATGTLATAGRRVNLVALVFDQLTANGRHLALAAARDFLDRHADAETYVAVFSIDGRLKLAQMFTRDREAARRSLEAAALGNAPTFSSSVAAMGTSLSSSRSSGDPILNGFDTRELRPVHSSASAEDLGAAGTPMDGEGGSLAAERRIAEAAVNMQRVAEEAERVQRGGFSLYGLLPLVHGLRTLPGRKTVLLFSEGLHVPPTLEGAFRALVGEANRSRVSLYGVDVRGLSVSSPFEETRELLDQVAAVSRSQRLSGSGGGGQRGVSREQVMQFNTMETALRMNVQGTLEDLATGTGGFLLANSNDMRQGLSRLGEDLHGFYEVAYVPHAVAYDGAFRAVDAKVRRPGAVVQTRSGYFALPLGVSGPVYGYEEPLLAALAARRPPRDLEHRARVFRFGAEPTAVSHTLVVEAPLGKLSFAKSAGSFSGRASMVALVKDERGNVVTKLSQDFLLEGPIAELDQARQRDLSWVRSFSLGPGRYSVVVAVRDGRASRVGVSRLPLEVAAPPAGLRLSSLVVVDHVAPLVGPEGPDDDPFVVGDVRVVPALEASRRAVAGSDTLALYCVVYSQEGMPAASRMVVEVVRGDKVVKRGEMALPAADRGGRIRHLATLPLDELAPGDYGVRVSVTQGAFTAAELAALTVG